MQRSYDAIYLSPHLDDVALSCGGQIFEHTAAGRSVLVVTVVAGDPPLMSLSHFAEHLHQQWQTVADVVAVRRQEDISACRILQAEYTHWDIPDAIYRVHPFTQEPFYTSTAALLGPIHAAESGLITAVARRLQNLPAHRQLFAPLAVGNHVDHQLTRIAAEHYSGYRLCYYEDYPYVQMPGLLDKALMDKERWQPEVVSVSPAAVQAKLSAVAAFTSQIKALFRDWENGDHLINNYLDFIGGERVWQYVTI